MNSKRKREYGYVTAHDLAPYTPGADAYDKDGTPIFNSKERAQAFYNRRRDMGGAWAEVDPDGGPPGAEDIESDLRRVRAEREKKSREKAKRRADLQRRMSGRVNIRLR